MSKTKWNLNKALLMLRVSILFYGLFGIFMLLTIDLNFIDSLISQTGIFLTAIYFLFFFIIGGLI